jgi:hypothetical protein
MCDDTKAAMHFINNRLLSGCTAPGYREFPKCGTHGLSSVDQLLIRSTSLFSSKQASFSCFDALAK